MQADDAQLIQRCLSGEKAAWEEFVERFTRLIYDGVIRTLRQFGHPADADLVEDLHHEVFVALLQERGRALRAFEGRRGCQLAHYIRTIAVRKTIDYLRRSGRTVSLDDQDEHGVAALAQRQGVPLEDVRDRLARQDTAQATEALLAGLPEEERRFCRMWFYERVGPAQIARHFQISVPHVYVRKHRILKRLKAMAKDRELS